MDRIVASPRRSASMSYHYDYSAYYAHQNYLGQQPPHLQQPLVPTYSPYVGYVPPKFNGQQVKPPAAPKPSANSAAPAAPAAPPPAYPPPAEVAPPAVTAPPPPAQPTAAPPAQPFIPAAPQPEEATAPPPAEIATPSSVPSAVHGLPPPAVEGVTAWSLTESLGPTGADVSGLMRVGAEKGVAHKDWEVKPRATYVPGDGQRKEAMLKLSIFFKHKVSSPSSSLSSSPSPSPSPSP